MPTSVQIEVTDEQIQEAIRGAAVRRWYDHDAEDWMSEPTNIADEVKRQLGEMVAKEIARITPDVVAGAVVAEVKRILTDGFPVVEQWGADTGKRTTVAEVVGKMLFTQSGGHRASVAEAIRSVRDQTVKAEVSKIVQAEADGIRVALRTAASDGLAKLMARALA